jgi:hypothetical protein
MVLFAIDLTRNALALMPVTTPIVFFSLWRIGSADMSLKKCKRLCSERRCGNVARPTEFFQFRFDRNLALSRTLRTSSSLRSAVDRRAHHARRNEILLIHPSNDVDRPMGRAGSNDRLSSRAPPGQFKCAVEFAASRLAIDMRADEDRRQVASLPLQRKKIGHRIGRRFSPIDRPQRTTSARASISCSTMPDDDATLRQGAEPRAPKAIPQPVAAHMFCDSPDRVARALCRHFTHRKLVLTCCQAQP